MFVTKVNPYWARWQKKTYVPYGVEGSVLFFGKGENTVSIDLEAEQQDGAVAFQINQDYNGNLIVGEGPLAVAYLEIPAEKTQLVDTGEVNEKNEPVMKVEKIPVDVDNCSLTLYPLQAPIENDTEGNM